jgi:Flp pilus assembly CpaE family ATPase
VEQVARVVLALEAPDVVEEVMHFLDRTGSARVVATAQDDRQLAAAVRQLEPDAVVAQPSLVSSTELFGASFLALDTRESVASLRAAIQAGARGFYLWPADRDALGGATADMVRSAPSEDRRARVVAVHGARGGAGATFVATHLAAALVRSGLNCVVLDADPLYGDVAAALGAPTEEVHTLADLLPLADELSAEHLGDALWAHPSGIRVLLPPAAERASSVRAEDLRSLIGAAAAACDALVLHLPRALDPLGRAGVADADRVIEVLSLDVLSFHAASRALEALLPLGAGERVGFVVNRSVRSEITPADVHRVFGVDPLAVVPYERGVARAQDHGRLMPSRGRLARAFDRLAAEVMRPEAVGSDGSPPVDAPTGATGGP